MSKLVAHLKGPKENGVRKSVFYPTHVDFVEGLDDKIIEVAGNSGSSGGSTSGTISVIPSQNGAVTYNGIAQQCTWNDYDQLQLEIDGDYEETDAGTYTVGFTPRGTCKWANGTQDRMTATWTIDKAAGTLSLSADSGSVYVSETGTFITTRAGDGTISAQSNDTSIASVSTNGNTITISGVAPGTAVITVNVAEGTNHLAPASVTYQVTISKRQITIPTVTDTSKTYNGSPQSPTVDNEPSTTYVSVINKSGTNAGNYTLTYTLTNTNMYEWTDQTTEPKEYPWTMSKAACTISLSTNAVNLTAASNTKNVTVTRSGDGTISASSTATNVATVSGTTTLTITGVANGSATINVNVAEGTNHLAADATIAVTSTIPNNTLNSNSWEAISEISQAGLGDTYWDVGDAKEIPLNGKIGSQLTLSNTKLCVFILDFNYKMNGSAENNIIWGGFKSALTGGKDVALVDSKYNTSSTDGTICFNMNHRGQTSNGSSPGYYNTNYGGWKGSDLRYDILGATSTQPSMYNQNKSTSNVGYDATEETLTNPKADTLLAALPSELRNVIRLWTRWIDAVGNSSNVDANIKATVDAITLLAEPEIFSSRNYANQYEQNHLTQMAYYKNGNGTIRYKHNDASSAVYWWASSPRYNNTNTFCNVDTNGGANNNSAYTAYAVAPAFKT